ncbi:MAG: hypothetical protein EZS28_042667, partial [Streblomastix strix]
MIQITGGTNYILINETIKHLSINGLSQCPIWCRNHVPLIDDQIEVVEQDREKPRWILTHGERHKHSLNLMVFYGAVAAFVESYILTIRTLNLPQLY